MSDILRIPVDLELMDRAKWLIRLRWLVLAVAAGVAVVAHNWLDGALRLNDVWAVLATVAGYNALFWIIAHRLVSHTEPHAIHTSLMHAQILADLVALTFLLHFTGGLENPFSTYYVLIVVIGSIMLMSKRAGYSYAAIATALWVGLLALEALGVIPHHNLAGFRLPMRYRELTHLVAESFVLGSANFGVAYLTSRIISRLREGQRQLYEANASCELRASELAELNRQLQEANLSCELRAGELAELNRQLQEANLSCELRAGELAELNRQLAEAHASCELRAEELARLNARLQELDRTRSLFIRLVTHELRAPVAAIQSYLRLILDGYVPQERLQEIVAKAEQRARDQLDLIGDLLDLARVQEPKDKVKVEPIDVAAVLHDVLDLMQARAQDKALDITVDVAPDVPRVMANLEHIKQIWMNLISNAIKYTPDGGRVFIALKAEGDRVRGVVQDTGIGMTPEEMSHIFENFYRTERAKAMAHHGTGLGLSIVKGLMERYGGRIWVESEVGKGSTFTFELSQAR